MHKTFAMVFDCNYGGDIDACDKDCKTLGYCKRRQHNPPPERVPGKTLSGKAGERFESSPEGSGASQPEQPSGPRVSAAPAPALGTTPRTDAIAWNAAHNWYEPRVSTDFARQLERELSSAQEQIAALLEALTVHLSYYNSSNWCTRTEEFMREVVKESRKALAATRKEEGNG